MTTNQQQWLTIGFLAFWASGLIAWDVFVLLRYGIHATISRSLLWLHFHHPLITTIGILAIGVVIGHVFVAQRVR